MSLMKSSPYLKLSAIVLAGLLASCSSPSPDLTRVPVSLTRGSDSSLNGKIFDGVNIYRAAKGKSILKRHAGLDAIAQKHCEYLAKNCGSSGMNIGHIGFEGRALVARQAYDITSIGENVASSTTKSADRLVDLWKSSKTHDHNMCSDWTYAGIGTAFTSDGMVISTQVFGGSENHGYLESKNRYTRAW